MNPAPLQPDSSLPRSIQQVRSQEAANIVENRRLAGWMEAMTPKIDSPSPNFEAACGGPHARATLEDMHRAIAARCQLPRSAQAGGSRSHDREVHSVSLMDMVAIDMVSIGFDVLSRAIRNRVSGGLPESSFSKRPGSPFHPTRSGSRGRYPIARFPRAVLHESCTSNPRNSSPRLPPARPDHARSQGSCARTLQWLRYQTFRM